MMGYAPIASPIKLGVINMIIENQKVEVRWHFRNKERYVGFGYEFTKLGDLFLVDACHLSDGTRCEVALLCDYCLEMGVETHLSKPFFKYVAHRKIVAKDCCYQCRDIKQKEVMIIKHGVPNAISMEKNSKKISDLKRTDFSIIENKFSETNCKLLSVKSDYREQTDKLSFICSVHEELGIQQRSWQSIKNSKVDTICSRCGFDTRDEKLRTNQDVVEQSFIEKGYILLPNQVYVNSSTKMDYTCEKHPDNIQSASYGKVIGRINNCEECYLETISGENCNFWNGGTTDEYQIARRSKENKVWRKSVFERDEYKCQCCGNNGQLNAHHIENFSQQHDKRYDISNGITMCTSCHMPNELGSFHNTYGTQNNDIFQLQEYFDDIRSELGLPLVLIEEILGY